MKINIPKLSLVVLVGPSGSGKSTFARRHFLPTEVVSSDACRAMVSDDENNQAVTPEAFALLHYVSGQRLALGRLTVIDATNVQPEARAPLVALARKYHCLPVAVVLNLPEEVCQERNSSRPDRAFGPHVIRNQRSQLRRSPRGLQREGFRHAFVLDTVEAVEAAVVERVPLWNDRTADHGPFDIIGDVHGCADELERLLETLGYGRTVVAGHEPGWSNTGYAHPEGRKVVFVGDLVDRGPRVLDTLGIARNMVASGSALCVPGNHDMKLLKKLNGRDVQITHGLAETLAEIDALPDDVQPVFTTSLARFLDGLVSHYVLDGGKLVVAHAGLKQEMQGRGSGKARDFCLYGETFSTGRKAWRWIDTPHVPHGWDCGVLFDQTTGTLLCGDLFTQAGAETAPVTEAEIVTASEAMRKPMDYYAHSTKTGTTLERLASLNPATLACQHGSAFRGDGAGLLRDLAKILEAEQRAALA